MQNSPSEYDDESPETMKRIQRLVIGIAIISVVLGVACIIAVVALVSFVAQLTSALQ